MLSHRWARTISELLQLYRELDREVESFAMQSGMRCPSGCGACCQSPHAETTVAEMLPLAWKLFQSGEWAETMDRLEADRTGICVQFNGRCRSYAERPALCRLFGYNGSRDRQGQLRYGACRVFQATEAAAIQKVDAQLLERTLDIPQLAVAHERVTAIDERFGRDIIPINEALRRALEIIGLDLQLGSAEHSPRLPEDSESERRGTPAIGGTRV